MHRFLGCMFVTSLLAAVGAAQDGDLFNKLDANKDGSITADEVPGDQQAKFAQLLKIAGRETDKKIGLAQFQAALKQLQTQERAAANPQAPAGQPAVDSAELFVKLDANKDGFVTADEVPEGQKSLFDRLVRNADTNGDKQLSKAEFAAGLKPDDAPRQPLAGGGPPGRRGGAAPQGDAGQRFQRLDANKDGKISKDELPEPLQQNFARLDANSDGSLSTEELARGGMGFLPRPGAPGAPPPEQLAADFDRLDANKDGKLTKDEVPEERQLMRLILDRPEAAGGVTKEQLLKAMADPQPRRPDGNPIRRPDGAPRTRPNGTPMPLPADALRPALAAIDANRDGELSAEEIAGAAKALLALDKNGDGKLSREEIGGGGGPQGRPGAGQPLVPGAGLRDRWKEADANGDGKLSKEEAPGPLKEQFDRIEANKDGVLDETEIQQFRRRMQ